MKPNADDDPVMVDGLGSSDSSSSDDACVSVSRVAVIGGGVAGMAAAWHLAVNTDNFGTVQLFEAHDRLGGHACTVPVQTSSGPVDVDIGFMVYNRDNYPNMIEWFKALSTSNSSGYAAVQEENSDMSFSVSLDSGQTVEWSSDGLTGLFAKPSQAVSLHFYQFVFEMIRFNTTAPDLLQLDERDPRKHITCGQYLRQHGYSTAFCHYYILPMMAALWSASMDDVLQFPAVQLISFFQNHKLLQVFDRPQWKTVVGRSQQYTAAVAQVLGEAAVHVSTPIVAVQRRKGDGTGTKDGKTTYELFCASSSSSTTTDDNNKNQYQSVGVFDEVIFACHPPTVSRILREGNNMTATVSDKDHPEMLLDLLSQIRYQDNAIYLHSDPALMPTRRAAWASWNCMGNSQYLPASGALNGIKKGEALEGAESGFGNTASHGSSSSSFFSSSSSSSAAPRAGADTDHDTSPLLEGGQGRMKAVYVTYWLNRLQNLKTDTNIFVSLNPHTLPDRLLTHKRVVLAHPQFTLDTLRARQVLLDNYQGQDGLWFCGAWAGYGFHEDGCRSGFTVATALSGVPLPWVKNAATNSSSSSSNRDRAVGAVENIMVAAAPDLSVVVNNDSNWHQRLYSFYKKLTYDLPVSVCKRFIYYFLKQAVQIGTLRLKLNDGTIASFGDGSPCGCDNSPVTLRVYDDWFFVKTALEYDLGLARSYLAGYFVVEPLDKADDYHPGLRPPTARDETTIALGDPVGLTRLFLLLIGNRDHRPLAATTKHVPRKSFHGASYATALTNASGLFIAKIGSFFNYLRFKLTMDNSERGGSLKNIHAHYDLSNDLFRTFLDPETLMYSCAIWDAVKAPSPSKGLVFRGTLEDAQWRKIDNLLNRAQIQPGQTVLDIGFGWGGLSLRAARKYGCKVTGITLSVEQKALAEARVKDQGLESLITFEVVDYRVFARRRENWGKFDRVLSCEMIEAVGHEHLGEFFWAVEQVLAHDGILVMQAITTPEERYESYIRSTDFMNTIIFPGGSCPCLHALVDASYRNSSLTLERVDNIGLHYAQTLAEWRRRFNASEDVVRSLAFDDVFLRCWNYYMTYCEAGFMSQTVNCLVLVFSRQGCSSLVPLSETRAVTQLAPLGAEQLENWLSDQR